MAKTSSRRGPWLIAGIALVGAVTAGILWWVGTSAPSEGELRSVAKDSLTKLENRPLDDKLPATVMDAFDEEVDRAAARRDLPAVEANLADYEAVEQAADLPRRLVLYVELRPAGETEPALCLALTETEESVPDGYRFTGEAVAAKYCES